MSDKSKIEWTDATWNPVTGCTKVSEGCERCYIARTPPFRIEGREFVKRCPVCHGYSIIDAAEHPCPNPECREGIVGDGIGATTGVQLHPSRLDQPLRWKRPRRIFVNSLSDLFHEDVPDEYIARVFAVMTLAYRHTFQVLTKRPGRMRSLLSSDRFREMVEYSLEEPGDLMLWPLPNVWLGVSVETQKWADARIPQLLQTPAAVRFLSCEPLLGPVCLNPWHTPHATSAAHCGPMYFGLDWVIVGGESGPHARPMHPDWARSLRDQCVAAGVAFHFKQWGEWAPAESAYGYRPAYTRGLTGQTPTGGHRTVHLDLGGHERSTNEVARFSTPYGWARLARVGKKMAGRELDGRTWDEYPGGAR